MIENHSIVDTFLILFLKGEIKVELYTLGYRVEEILEETSNVLKPIDLSDTEICQKLTNLFLHAKGRSEEDAKKSGMIPLVAKLILIDYDRDVEGDRLILFDERNTPDQKDKVSIPGGHVEDVDISLCGEYQNFYNFIHCTIYREYLEELLGESSFYDMHDIYFQQYYAGTLLSVFPSIVLKYGSLVTNQPTEPIIYYQFSKAYEPIIGRPFLIFYVPIRVREVSIFDQHCYKSHCFTRFSRDDLAFVNHVRTSSNYKMACYASEFGSIAKDDIRIASVNYPKSMMLPAIFNTKEIWNPIE